MLKNDHPSKEFAESFSVDINTLSDWMFILAVDLLIYKIINIRKLEENKLNLWRTELNTLYKNLTSNLAIFILSWVPI